MTLVGYPSSDFPPPPKFSMRIPDGWQAAWPDGTLLAVHGPAPDGGVIPNVLVTSQRLPTGGRLDRVVAYAAEQLRQATPARKVETPRRLEIEGALDAALLVASFTNPDGVGVLQRQLILQVDSVGPGTAVLEVTATCGLHNVEQILEIVGSLEFTPVESSDLLPDAVT
jgi:hypothetical protein